MSILGFDLGTGACKGVAFDENGTILASRRQKKATRPTADIRGGVSWTRKILST